MIINRDTNQIYKLQYIKNENQVSKYRQWKRVYKAGRQPKNWRRLTWDQYWNASIRGVD